MFAKQQRIKIGFWDESGTLEAWSGRHFPPGTKELVLFYLRDRGFRDAVYRGCATCRLCGDVLGNADYSDGRYTWPEQVEHYILKHKLVPPDAFINWVCQQMSESDVQLDEAVSYVRNALLDMPDEERVELLHHLQEGFCVHCGNGPRPSNALPCRCWDDS